MCGAVPPYVCCRRMSFCSLVVVKTRCCNYIILLLTPCKSCLTLNWHSYQLFRNDFLLKPRIASLQIFSLDESPGPVTCQGLREINTVFGDLMPSILVQTHTDLRISNLEECPVQIGFCTSRNWVYIRTTISVYTREYTWSPDSSVLQPDELQPKAPPPLIAHQYSSGNFISLRCHSRNRKSARFEKYLTFRNLASYI
jgi:hypothetical protein